MDSKDRSNHKEDKKVEAKKKNRNNVDRPFLCLQPECGKRFNRRFTLSEHMKTHTGDKPYKCIYPGCESRFSTSGNLSRHKKVHLGGRSYPCKAEGCNLLFTSPAKYEKHLKTHYGARPFVCSVIGCDKRFSSSGNLTRHSKTHLSDPSTLVESEPDVSASFMAPLSKESTLKSSSANDVSKVHLFSEDSFLDDDTSNSMISFISNNTNILNTTVQSNEKRVAQIQEQWKIHEIKKPRFTDIPMVKSLPRMDYPHQNITSHGIYESYLPQQITSYLGTRPQGGIVNLVSNSQWNHLNIINPHIEPSMEVYADGMTGHHATKLLIDHEHKLEMDIISENWITSPSNSKSKTLSSSSSSSSSSLPLKLNISPHENKLDVDGWLLDETEVNVDSNDTLIWNDPNGQSHSKKDCLEQQKAQQFADACLKLDNVETHRNQLASELRLSFRNVNDKNETLAAPTCTSTTSTVGAEVA